MSKFASFPSQSGTRRGRDEDVATTFPTPRKDAQPTDLSPFDLAAFRREHPEMDDDSCILGIDEAGRGPAIGDMVYAAAMISLGQHGRIAQTGAADSKTLDEAARKACRSKLEALGSETDTTFAAFVRAVSAREIAAAMTGRDGRSLNTVSHDAAIELIRRAVLHARGRLSAVFVDTVGPPETYQRLLRGRFPHLHIVVSKKADRRFPVVSAASIYAKTDRDEGVKALGLDVGSGYPSDPKTVQWLAAGNLHRFFGFTNREVRQSWGPVAAVVRRECVALEFEQDRDPEDDPRQQKLSFAKPPPRRDPAFGLFLGLASTTELSLA